jgi:iron complex outermembrane recepter protein
VNQHGFGEFNVTQKRNLLSLALASAMLGLFSVNQAFAQSADDANSEDEAKAAAEAAAEEAAGADDEMLDAVIVTGIRGAIESSTNIKKNQTSIVESITAEDIGKLPDQSIAESIARLPGLSAQRVAGRAQVISVRGLSPDFATTLLNGRELVSTGDNRSVEFDQYPSELISGVTIYKTPDSGIVGQGLSGTIDMRTVRPLDMKDSVFVVGARAQDNSLGSASNASGTGNRINLTYIGKSESGNFGYALGISRSDTPIQENQVGLYGSSWRRQPPWSGRRNILFERHQGLAPHGLHRTHRRLRYAAAARKRIVDEYARSFLHHFRTRRHRQSVRSKPWRL